MNTPSPDVLAAIYERQSMRAFLPTTVDRATIEKILDAARHAPSGTNTQPWNVYVVGGETRNRLCESVLRVREEQPERERGGNVEGEYRFYSDPMTEPYLSRRREVGWDMYRSLGIVKGDRAGSWKVAGRNYQFFDAPIGLIFTLERVLEKGSWIDLGIYMQSVMLAARHFGLDTCPQGAWARYHDVVRECLDIPHEQIVVCGMALGHADRAAPANALRARREPLAALAKFIDIPTDETSMPGEAQ